MSTIIKVIKYIILSPILAVLGIVWLYTFLRKKYCTKHIFRHINIDTIDSLNGFDFEELVGIMFKAKGFKVTYTPKTKDYGADIIATKKRTKIVVQTKLYYNHSVGNKAVQEVHTAKHFYEAQEAVVVTNWRYSSAAITMANKLNVKLIDRNDLITIINNLQKIENKDPLKQLLD